MEFPAKGRGGRFVRSCASTAFVLRDFPFQLVDDSLPYPDGRPMPVWCRLPASERDSITVIDDSECGIFRPAGQYHLFHRVSFG